MDSGSLPFHTLDWQRFQKIVNLFISVKHDIPIESYALGPDGGRDGGCRHCNIKLGNEIKRNQDIIIQTKHTKKIEPLTKSKAEGLLKEDLKKIKAWVEKGKCDICFIVTNYSTPANVADYIEEKFESTGCIAFYSGLESINAYLDQNARLKRKIENDYHIGTKELERKVGRIANDSKHIPSISSNIQKTKRVVETVSDGLGQLHEGVKQLDIGMKQINDTQEEMKELILERNEKNEDLKTNEIRHYSPHIKMEAPSASTVVASCSSATDRNLSDCLIRHLSRCSEALVEEIHPDTIYQCLIELGQAPTKWPQDRSLPIKMELLLGYIKCEYTDEDYLKLMDKLMNSKGNQRASNILKQGLDPVKHAMETKRDILVKMVYPDRYIKEQDITDLDGLSRSEKNSKILDFITNDDQQVCAFLKSLRDTSQKSILQLLEEADDSRTANDPEMKHGKDVTAHVGLYMKQQAKRKLHLEKDNMAIESRVQETERRVTQGFQDTENKQREVRTPAYSSPKKKPRLEKPNDYENQGTEQQKVLLHNKIVSKPTLKKQEENEMNVQEQTMNVTESNDGIQDENVNETNETNAKKENPDRVPWVEADTTLLMKHFKNNILLGTKAPDKKEIQQFISTYGHMGKYGEDKIRNKIYREKGKRKEEKEHSNITEDVRNLQTDTLEDNSKAKQKQKDPKKDNAKLSMNTNIQVKKQQANATSSLSSPQHKQHQRQLDSPCKQVTSDQHSVPPSANDSFVKRNVDTQRTDTISNQQIHNQLPRADMLHNRKEPTKGIEAFRADAQVMQDTLNHQGPEQQNPLFQNPDDSKQTAARVLWKEEDTVLLMKYFEDYIFSGNKGLDKKEIQSFILTYPQMEKYGEERIRNKIKRERGNRKVAEPRQEQKHDSQKQNLQESLPDQIKQQPLLINNSKPGARNVKESSQNMVKKEGNAKLDDFNWTEQDHLMKTHSLISSLYENKVVKQEPQIERAEEAVTKQQDATVPDVTRWSREDEDILKRRFAVSLNFEALLPSTQELKVFIQEYPQMERYGEKKIRAKLHRIKSANKASQ